MRTEPELVDTYIASIPKEHQAILKTLREWILEISPEIIENLDYGMPTYHNGSRYCSFAHTRNYVAFYTDANLVKQYRMEFPGLNIEKNSIRFHDISDLPKSTFLRIIKESLVV